jgi:hypothetical protein
MSKNTSFTIIPEDVRIAVYNSLQNLQNFLHDVMAKSLRSGSVQTVEGRRVQSAVSSHSGESVKDAMLVSINLKK